MSNDFARTPLTKAALRLAAAATIMGGLAACSTMESLDPTGLLGGDSTGATSDTGGLSDAGQAADQDTTQPQATTDAAPGATPDVAAIPDKPEAPSNADQNAQVASSLQADAANVQYSADSLRGGTEASAPAPGAASPATDTQVAEATPPAAQTPAAGAPAPADVPADNTTPGTAPMSEAPAQPAAAPPPPDAPATAEAPMTEAPAQPAPAPPPGPAAADAVPEPGPDQTPAQPDTAQATPETPAQPAPAAPPDATPAPAPAPVQMASAGPVPGAQAPVTRRAAPGFAPSHAPALDPSVSQFVAAPVVARYRQTAMLQPSSYPDYTTTPGYFGPATAVVNFPGDTTILDERGLQQVRAAAELFKSHGGQGYVRIVGYASAASGSLSDTRLMHVNFDHSQARATTIARALMKEGVPASKVLVDAAPQTAATAKAEIFVQG